MVSLTANIEGSDLGHIAKQVEQAIREAGDTPPGISVAIRGQVPAMNQMLGGLQSGLLLAVVVIFCYWLPISNHCVLRWLSFRRRLQ